MGRKKQARKAAMEVCWGISIAANFNFTHKEMIEFIWNDFMKWADNTKFPGDCENHLGQFDRQCCGGKANANVSSSPLFRRDSKDS